MNFIASSQSESSYNQENIIDLMTVILEFLHNDCVIQDEEIRKENERLAEERKKEERRRQI